MAMQENLRRVNSLLGIVVSTYANLDIGKPLRLRSDGISDFLKRFYHLTHIGLLLSTLTFFMAMFIGRIERARNCSHKQNVIACYNHLLALVITAECFIPVIFWILWMIDESNVVRKQDYVGEDTISLFFNLCMHGIPSIFLLIEFMMFDFKATKKHYLALGGFFVIYLGVMGLFYYNTGMWPYKIIGKFEMVWKIVFFVGCFASLCLIYEILVVAHALVRRRRMNAQNSANSAPSPKKEISAKKGKRAARGRKASK